MLRSDFARYHHFTIFIVIELFVLPQDAWSLSRPFYVPTVVLRTNECDARLLGQLQPSLIVCFPAHIKDLTKVDPFGAVSNDHVSEVIGNHTCSSNSS